jgi:hypothetical protein
VFNPMSHTSPDISVTSVQERIMSRILRFSLAEMSCGELVITLHTEGTIYCCNILERRIS